jgi:uncharacterized protein with PQ loop repeat
MKLTDEEMVALIKACRIWSIEGVRINNVDLTPTLEALYRELSTGVAIIERVT